MGCDRLQVLAASLTLSVHHLSVRDGDRKNVPHSGDAAPKGALVLAGMGIQRLNTVTTSDHRSRAPYGNSWRLA